MDTGKLMSSIVCDVPGVEVLREEPMSRHTTFKIGGPADLFCVPQDADALIELLKWAHAEDVPALVIGGGSNLLVRDGGIRGAVISTVRLAAMSQTEDGEVQAECGAPLARLAAYVRDLGLGGLEFAQGIPGSVGGGIYMNAGAYGGEMKGLVTETDAVTPEGELVTVRGEEHRFGYRESCFTSSGAVVLRTRLRLPEGDRAAIAAQMEEYRERRRRMQPLESPSAGSTFKRPPGFYAGKLIEETGLKGLTVGGACVSEKHAGFIINKGGATARDVLELIEEVRTAVRREHGVLLEPEIKVVGEE